MTVESETNRNDYTGDGAHNEYAFTFPIQAESDLRVVVADSNGDPTVLTLTTDYTVDGVGEAAGGSITLVAGKAWMTSGYLTNGYAICVRRAPALKQSGDVRNQGAYYPETHEALLDRLVMQIQSLQEQVNRCLKLPEPEAGTEDNATMPVSADRASKVLSFDANGNPVAAIAISTYVQSMTYIGLSPLTELPAAPSGPTLCVVESGGVRTLYFYNGSSWEALLTMS